MTENDIQVDSQDNVPVEPQVSDVTDNDEQAPVFNKFQVQDVVKREKQKAYEKGRREALMELEQQQTPQQPQQTAPNQQQNIGGIPQLSQADIEKLIAEKAPQALQQHVQDYQLKQMVNGFVSKMTAAEERYPGLEQKLDLLDYDKPSTLELVNMANSLENTGDIMNELLENPEKMSSILGLIREQPRLALNRMQSLSNSIKQNQQALSENESSRDPIGQMKPSKNTGRDNGNLSVSEYRKIFRA